MDTPKPTPTPATTSRGAQLALGVFLALLLGLLALRGYGNWIGAKPTQSASATLTDLNRADRADLEQVPGIGPGLAKHIDDHRRTKGPFKSVDELKLVKGFGPATFDKVRAYVRVESQAADATDAPLEPLVLQRKPAAPAVSAPIPRSGGAGHKLQPGDAPIDVNAAGVAELMRIPGVGPVTARNIVNARAETPFATVADLRRVKGIGAKTLEKLQPFVTVKSP